jgi:hypothetical protein
VLKNNYANKYLGFIYVPNASQWFFTMNDDFNNMNTSNGVPYTRYTFYMTDKNQIVNYDSNNMLCLKNDMLSFTTNYNDNTIISAFFFLPGA